jgi:ABC-type antimicrobial peptide transport system permease subunit
MKNFLLKNALRSLLFYRKDYVNQVIIIALLAAIVTGSLLTGSSVRDSLKKNSSERLGNTGFLVSSGLRFFDSSVSERLTADYQIMTTPLLETYGYCQNFATGSTSLNISIYGISGDFFRFNGIDDVEIAMGTVAVNDRMADHLGVKEGDEIIIRFREADPIPANAPFAPSGNGDGSKVMKISKILGAEKSGNFSLGISQVVPQNLFINLQDLQQEGVSSIRVNRLLVAGGNEQTGSSIYDKIGTILTPSDIGLSIRKSPVTGESEIISDRVFIDSSIVNRILNIIPGGYPVITYLANNLISGSKETPYSFVSGLPSSQETDIADNEIIISRWLADDLGTQPGNEITLKWYHTVGNLLEERERSFMISDIYENESPLSDPTLMPEFPGISGSTSCSSWDAGIPILMDKIRDKDEDYWNKYKGSPKAFVNYKTGKSLWGNNFGPATAVRFHAGIDNDYILKELKGKLDPSDAGFTVKNVRISGEEAASQGVDFSTLFLSLGFFIILSCIILLSFSVSLFFESKKEQVRTYFALGFRNGKIAGLLFLETVLISVAGASAGVFLGYGVNIMIIHALNSVWTGAVQTDTISPALSIFPIITGFILTLIISLLLSGVKLRLYLNKLAEGREKGFKFHSSRFNFILLIIISVFAVILTSLTFAMQNPSVALSFSGGTLLFASLILILRQYYIRRSSRFSGGINGLYRLSRRFYVFNPSQAVAPVIFIAAGIFAIIITSSNRQGLTDEMLRNEGGTGGYLFWSESALPVSENLNTPEGRAEFGLNEEDLSGLEILQALRLAGDDASCLNLNHIKAPPLLGLDPSSLIRRGSFSFATAIDASGTADPWSLLNMNIDDNIIYGIADQTVLKWGLKINVGDTLVFMAENGKPLKIILCAGLKSSVFQGHLLIGEKNFRNFFPSIAGSTVYLFDSDQKDADSLRDLLSNRFSNYGLSVETAAVKLASFFVVTNTYLNVFTILGILGLILGVAGLGFMLIRNYEQRRREFALMMATGYSSLQLRRYILVDQVIILVWGIITGTLSALVATLPSMQGGGEMSLSPVIVMVASIFVTGMVILIVSVSRVSRTNLLIQLRKD